MKNIQKSAALFAIALLTAIGAAPQRAAATAIQTVTYNVTLDADKVGRYSLNTIYFWSDYPATRVPPHSLDPAGSSVSLSAPGGTLTQTGPEGVVDVFVLGLIKSGAVEEHLVLFMNKAVKLATEAPLTTFEELFPKTTESDLIKALHMLAAGSSDINDALPLLLFGTGDAQDAKIPFAPEGGQFNVVSFTDGVVIGTGTTGPLAQVPVPGTLALFGLGWIAFATIGRRLA